MLRYGYFDSEIIGTDAEGMPIFDRAETSDLFRLLFAKLVSNGVLADPGDCFQVLASDGLNLTVRPGFGLIQGAFAYDDSAETYTLAQAPTQYARIDRIVLRANYADRLCEIVVKTGEVAATPVAPELLQPASGDYYELSLATVYISANATAVTQSNITDTRGDSSVCGYITQLIDHLDTSTFYAQLDQFYLEFVQRTEHDYDTSRASYLQMLEDIVAELTAFEGTAESDFDEWFQSIKDKFSGDIAGSLQLQIDNLTQRLFEDEYSLCRKVSSIVKNSSGVTTQIVEIAKDETGAETVRAVTTFTKNAAGETERITTVVTPVAGNYFYTKTAVFSTIDIYGSKEITESYTQSIKE